MERSINSQDTPWAKGLIKLHIWRPLPSGRQKEGSIIFVLASQLRNVKVGNAFYWDLGPGSQKTFFSGAEMKYSFWTSVCFLVTWGELNLSRILKYWKMWTKSLWERDSISKNPFLFVLQRQSTANPGSHLASGQSCCPPPPGQDRAYLRSPVCNQHTETWKSISTMDSPPRGICLNSGNVLDWPLESWLFNFTDSCLYELILLWLLSWTLPIGSAYFWEWDAENYLA